MSADRARRASAAILCALTVGAAEPIAAQMPSQDSIARILETRVARGGTVGLVAATITGDGESRIAASGRRAGPGTPAPDANTIFEIGSISKVFTTLLLADMVVRGEVSLDDPVACYLPSSARVPSRGGREITLLDLATATSGLPRLPTGFAPANMLDPYADYDAEKLYAFLSSYTLPRDPGATYEYSNVGMGLLGHALARRAGTTYEAAVTERILRPLGMHDTRITLGPEQRARLAQGHNGGLEPVPNWTFDVIAGAGAWRSTTEDMLRFLRAAMSPPDGTLGRAFALAIEPRQPTGIPGLSIGLGWHILERDGMRIVWHNGQTGGYHAFAAFSPTTSRAAIVLANATPTIDDIGFHLIDPSRPVRHPGAPPDQK